MSTKWPSRGPLFSEKREFSKFVFFWRLLTGMFVFMGFLVGAGVAEASAIGQTAAPCPARVLAFDGRAGLNAQVQVFGYDSFPDLNIGRFVETDSVTRGCCHTPCLHPTWPASNQPGDTRFGYDVAALFRVSHAGMATNTGARALGNGIELTEGGVRKIIYREGAPSPSNLTPRAVDEEGLSFRDSLSNPTSSANRPVLQPGKDFIGIDTSKLPPGSVVYDNVPPGHVSVRGVTPEQLKAAVVERGKLPK